MTCYDTEFHLLCTCQTIEYEQQQKLTIHSPLCFEMTEDLQIYALMLLFFALFSFCACLFVRHMYFLCVCVDLMCLVVNRTFIMTAFLITPLSKYLTKHICTCECNFLFVHFMLCWYLLALFWCCTVSAHELYRCFRGKLHIRYLFHVIIIKWP